MSTTTTVREWGEMSASERNALVAEHVMGYRFWLETRGEYTLAVWSAPGAREPWMGSRMWREEEEQKRYTETTAGEAYERGFFGTEPPRWTKDIASAFLVVDRMRALGWLWFDLFEDVGGVVCATFSNANGMSHRGYATTDTRADAICAAALRAQGART